MAFDDHLRGRSSSRDDQTSYDPDEYQRGRQRIDLKLKGTFERIFEKYAKDFTGVGDEIDLETGEVVVNNGHLTYMQHERDTGKSASSQFVRAFAEELEVEDGHVGNEDSEVNEDDESLPHMVDALPQQDIEDNELQQDSDDDELQYEPAELGNEEEDEHVEEDISDEDDGNYEDAAVEAGDEQSGDESDDLGHDPDAFPLDPRLAQSDASISQEQQYHNTSVVQSTELSHSLPQISISDSLKQLVPHQDAEGRVNPEAVQQLGQSIANQIAQFLTRATAINRQSQPLWSVPPLPQDAFDSSSFYDHPRDAITPAPHRAPSVWDSPSGGQSLWGPTASRPKKRRRLLKHTETSFDLDDAGFSDYKRGYSREEDDLIKRLKEINGLTWQQITAHVPGRTVGGLSGRYTRVLKDLPKPVIIKREIIEIMEGEDELSSPGPSQTVVSNSPGMSPFRTPLLRRAMDKQIARHGDSGEIPITIGDETDDTDSQNYTSETPETDAPQPAKKRRKSEARNHHFGAAGQYRTFDTSNPAAHFGILRTVSPTPYTAEQHNMDFYGSNSGFGVLRMDRPTKRLEEESRSKREGGEASEEKEPYGPTTSRYTYPAPQLRDRLANTPGSTINLFARAEQYLRAKGLVAASMATSQLRSSMQARQHSNIATARPKLSDGSSTMMPPPAPRPRAEPVLEGSSPLPTHPPPPYSANPPPPQTSPQTPLIRRTEPMVIDTENDGDISDSSITDTPATAKRYGNTPNTTTINNGPYFLSNMPLPPSLLVPAPQAQMRMPSSSPLSSPPPMSSPPASQTPPTEDLRHSMRSSSRQATKKSSQSTGPAAVAKMQLSTPSSTLRKSLLLSTPKTPITRFGTPLRETVGRKEMSTRKAMAEPDDGSEDELA
ncbi:hypothetical protein E4T47_02571 [Aureobasidium subglaciale]|nr:hypothetical protein E4T47_02571 [Aureobasidium subglaciale]